MYDPNGNLQSDGEFYYEYNNFNQMIRIRNGTSSGTTLEEFAYDPDGIRLYKKEYYSTNGSLKRTTLYPVEEFVREKNASGSSTDSVYFYAADTLIAQLTGSNLTYSHANQLGTGEVITNTSGGVVERTTLEPYGRSLRGGNQRYVFTGHERDDEIGLDYMKARYYSPDMAMFVQPDSIQENVYDPQTLNRYAYVKNHPTMLVDPTGQFSQSLLSLGIFMAAADTASAVYGGPGGIALAVADAPVTLSVLITSIIIGEEDADEYSRAFAQASLTADALVSTKDMINGRMTGIPLGGPITTAFYTGRDVVRTQDFIKQAQGRQDRQIDRALQNEYKGKTIKTDRGVTTEVDKVLRGNSGKVWVISKPHKSSYQSVIDHTAKEDKSKKR